jgi:hypothetical protein
MDAFENFLLEIKDNAFTRQQFEYRRWQMDLSLKQEFMDQAFIDGSYANYNLTGDEASRLTGYDSDLNDSDSFSDLFVPLMVKGFRAYLVHMSNLCFPANGDWLNLTRGFSQYFYQTGIEGFLPFVNDAWVDIIKTENQRFNFKERYKATMAESISYGNTVLGHDYDPLTTVVTPFSPGIGSAGIYPISDDWRKSNLVFYYDVNYNQLSQRTDLDQEIISQIEPEMSITPAREQAGMGSARHKDEYFTPSGKVRCYDFFIPSLFIKDGDEVIEGNNIYLTALIKPQLRAGSKLKKQEVYIIKRSDNVSPVEHGLLFAAFSTNMPGVFYNQGPLQPFLPLQYVANQLVSGASRSAAMVIDPPRSITSATAYGMVDPAELDLPVFEAGANYPNVKIDNLFSATEGSNSLSVYLNWINYIDRSFEEGIGVGKNQTGGMHQGRKTAVEIKESYSGTQLNLVEAANNYDQQILRPSIICRIRAEQNILEEQVRKSVIEILESAPDLQNEDEAYELALRGNELFNRLLNYSGIEASYVNFYKKTQADRLKDYQILQEVQQMAQQIQSQIAFADSPIMPPPPIPQTERVNPETGQVEVVPPAAQIAQIQQQWVQQQNMEREKARMDAKTLEVDMKIKQLTFKDVKEPPLPSKKLFYEMLIASISDSDVVVTGSMTTVSKELARENYAMLLNALNLFPPSVTKKIDYESILALLARANDVPIRDIFKDESQILRDEIAEEQEAMKNQQMQMQMLQNPGSQIPKLPGQ